MDSNAPSRSRPPIWQKWYPTPRTRKTCGLSKKSCNRKEEVNIPGFHTRNTLGKPPSLLRLSSTGDTEDDSSDFLSLEPANLRGSESNLPGSTCVKPNSALLNRFAKFAFSASCPDFRQSTTKSFASKSSESMARQADLSILMEKFDSHQQSNIDRPNVAAAGQFMRDGAPVRVHPQQGGPGGGMRMRGFVKEGIYHPFPSDSPSQAGSARPNQPAPLAPEMQRPGIHAFPFCISTLWNPYGRQHLHPYVSTSRFVHDRRPMASVQFGHSTPTPDVALVTSDRHTRHTPLSHVSPHGCPRQQIRDSALLSSWIIDPRVRSQFINTECIAARLQQEHDATNLQRQHRTPHHTGRKPMTNTRTLMTQQNQNPNRAAGCVHTGSTYQAHRHPTRSKTTTSKQSARSPKHSAIHQSGSKCLSGDKTKHQDNRTNSEAGSNRVESVNDEAKLLNLPAENESSPTITESQVASATDSGQIMPCWAHVTSSIDGVIPCSAAEQTAQATSVPKLDTDETSRYESSTSTDTDNVGESHPFLCSQDKHDDIRSEPTQSQTARVPESCNFTLEDDGVSKSTPSRNCEDGDCRGSVGSSPEESGSSPNPKPLHSSLAFLLAEVIESDFSDSDWDSIGSSPPSDSWDFLKCSDDPYNPLYGWRCAKRSERQDHEQETDSKPDDELDSGISSLQAQQDDRADVSPAASESWDEDEPDLDLEESSSTQSAKPATACALKESVHPSNRSVGSVVINTLKASVPDPCAATDPTLHCPRVQLHVPDNRGALTGRQEGEPEASESSSCDPSKSKSIPTPRSIVREPQKLHPSVLFILGADDSDSDAECDDEEDDFDECDADNFDTIWSTSQRGPDLYSPLQGWPFQLTIPANKSCGGDDDDLPTTSPSDTADGHENSTSSAETLRRFAAEPNPRPELKRASSTGCLWIPCDGSGPGRPLHNKKVHFCADSPKVINFESPSWSSEYSDSRRGHWQEMARDRCRFRDRIRCTEAQIAHVFTPEHRQRVHQRLQTQSL